MKKEDYAKGIEVGFQLIEFVRENNNIICERKGLRGQRVIRMKLMMQGEKASLF